MSQRKIEKNLQRVRREMVTRCIRMRELKCELSEEEKIEEKECD
jgi:hypothetical protein